MKYYRDSIVDILRCLIIVVMFLCGSMLLSCQSDPLASKMKTVTPPQEALVANDVPKVEIESPSRITFQPGDVIEIKFYYTPDLNESQTIRPDGKIALQLVGEVEVQGKTPAELREVLLDLYTPSLKAPEIAVIVRSFYNRRVFVGGQVMTPGIVQMPGKMTVLEAIMRAGGFDLREAEVRNVVVIRHKDGRRYGYSVNLKSALVGNETEQFFLEPKDIVYVPRTEIAKLGQWIDQHINQIIPDTGIIFTRTSGNTTVGVGSYR